MILCKTPLRVSFLGGGTDFPEYYRANGGGAVLGTAIDKYLYHSVMPFHSRLFDYSVRIAYRKVECVASVDQIEHAPFREVLRHVGISKDVEISVTSDLPSFSGLGSSSSFVVGLLNALHAYRGRAVTKMELSRQAIRIEREVLREAVGCQDQVFAAFGGCNLVEFSESDEIVVHRIPLTREQLAELEASLLVFYTGIGRKAVDLEAKKVANMHWLGESLRTMRGLVDEGYRVMTGGGAMSALGELLDRSWQVKKQLEAGVSNETIDAMYAAGRSAGALGGKILGAGGGGFLLLFVPPERHEAVRAALASHYEIEIGLGAPGSQIVHA
jgi:D-glycero-alpha-D-manno-heptose-7-phosphate kinase